MYSYPTIATLRRLQETKQYFKRKHNTNTSVLGEDQMPGTRDDVIKEPQKIATILNTENNNFIEWKGQVLEYNIKST